MALLAVANDPKLGLDGFWQEAERLRDVFKFEFFYAPIDEFRKQVNVELQCFYPEWESRLQESSSGAQNLLLTCRPLFAHCTLLPFVEAYRVVADVLARAGEEPIMDVKDCVKQSLAYARQAYLQQRITSEASIGKLMFENGYKLMSNMGLVFKDSSELESVNLEQVASDRGASLAQRRIEMSQSLRELCRRLDTIRSTALLR